MVLLEKSPVYNEAYCNLNCEYEVGNVAGTIVYNEAYCNLNDDMDFINDFVERFIMKHTAI